MCSKGVISAIASPFSLVINNCLKLVVFPDSLKIARTIFIFKKGNAEDMRNHILISIRPVMSKVIETASKVQLGNYLKAKNLLTDAQHGFRRDLSTNTALITLATTISEHFEAGNSAALQSVGHLYHMT